MPKLTRFDEIISNYGHFVVRWRWLILLVSILLAAAAITGTRHLEFKSDYRIWFSAENPQLQAFERRVPVPSTTIFPTRPNWAMRSSKK